MDLQDKIPRVIHYCWFGDAKQSSKIEECISSWKRYCPNYEIKLWNEKNFDINCSAYCKEAYENKKWAFVSDYVRLSVIYQYGGVYLDTDVELIRDLDDLLKMEAFMCVEQDLNIATGLGFGAAPKNDTVKSLLEVYENIHFEDENGNINLVTCPIYTTNFFEQHGYKKDGTFQKVCNVVLLPSDYFCPLNYKNGRLNITDNTHGIHWYAESWMSENDRKIHQMEWKINNNFSPAFATIICICYRNLSRFIQYAQEGTLSRHIKRRFKRKWKRK